jgi:hypothetical protein
MLLLTLSGFCAVLWTAGMRNIAACNSMGFACGGCPFFSLCRCHFPAPLVFLEEAACAVMQHACILSVEACMLVTVQAPRA